jgi:hypothetical protein
VVNIGTVTGRDARIWIASGGANPASWKTHSQFGLSDFSLTLGRGTVEQELVGETGNYFAPGSLSIDGSYTNCRFAASANAEDVYSIINATYIWISGTTGSNLRWCFASAMVTGYDVSIGDADTISEASIDFIVMDPYNVTWEAATGLITNTR